MYRVHKYNMHASATLNISTNLQLQYRNTTQNCKHPPSVDCSPKYTNQHLKYINSAKHVQALHKYAAQTCKIYSSLNVNTCTARSIHVHAKIYKYASPLPCTANITVQLPKASNYTQNSDIAWLWAMRHTSRPYLSSQIYACPTIQLKASSDLLLERSAQVTQTNAQVCAKYKEICKT